MEPYPQQQPSSFTQGPKAPFTWSTRHLLLVMAICLVVGCAGYLWFTAPWKSTANGGVVPTPLSEGMLSTQTPSTSNPSHWVTSQSFTAKGIKKTATFTVPGNWRIVWNCNLASHNDQSYDVTIHANTVNNALLANSVETVCNKNNTHGSTMIHQAGKIYLVIISQGDLTVQVQY